MSLKILVALPDDTKLFIDFLSSAVHTKNLHPELSIDVLTNKDTIPSWLKVNFDWFKTFETASSAQSEYDLIIQLEPSQKLANELQGITTKHRTGVVLLPEFHIEGNWCQIFISQFMAKRFAPFTPKDLFCHILIGKNSGFKSTKVKEISAKTKWYFDLSSINKDNRLWAESFHSNLSRQFPNHVTDDFEKEININDLDIYVGSDPVTANWCSYNNKSVLFILNEDWNSKYATCEINTWYVLKGHKPSATQILSMLKANVTHSDGVFKLTNEFLGGLFPSFDNSEFKNINHVLDQIHYIVFNYTCDLLETNLPIPKVDSSTCLRLKGMMAVFGKLSHLNMFGIKFIQEFLSKNQATNLIDSDVTELSQKIQEIDQLTDKTLSAYGELDLLRHWIQFSKANIAGSNVIEISKSLVLLFNEINQSFAVYDDLIGTIVKKYQAIKQESETK